MQSNIVKLKDLAGSASVVLNKGGVVVYPTETVYGLGGNAFNKEVVERTFKIKGRETGKPLIVLVKDFKTAGQIVDLVSYEELLKKYWPGPLTGVFKSKLNFPAGVVSKEGTIAIRISSHPFVQKLFEFIDFPITSTSANKSGDKNSFTIKEIKKSLGVSCRLVNYFIDWGNLNTKAPSTVVNFVSIPPKIIRQGSIIFL